MCAAATFAPAPRSREGTNRNGPTADVVLSMHIAEVVSCHAFSPGLARLAVCPNNEEIHIYDKPESARESAPSYVLSGHTQRVTGLAWSCHGRLASVAEDRTSFVWELDEEDLVAGPRWRMVNVELKAPRAALSIAWSPDGARFAVGLASKEVAVCQYEAAVSCWICARRVGRAKASVGALSWHPTSQFLAVGTMDRRCSVYDVNDEMKPPYGEAQVTENAGAWVNAVSFSPSGALLAYACQDSSVHFRDLRQGLEGKVNTVRWRRLPFLRIAFVSDDRHLVACGFDYVPVLFRLQDAGSWEVIGSLDAGPAASVSGAAFSKRDSFQASRDHFKGLTGTSRDANSNGKGNRCHTNTITGCAYLDGARFSTSGLDGRVVVWELVGQ